MIAAVLLGLGLVLASPAPAIDPAALDAHIRALADDGMEGRGTGSPGHLRAERYVAGAFAAAGLVPAGSDGWFQPVSLRRATPEGEGGRVALTAGGRTSVLRAPRQAWPWPDPARTASSVRARVVFVGQGIVAPDQGVDSYRGMDVEGAVVAVLVGAPARFPAAVRAVHADPDTKLEQAARHGAAGVLLLWTGDSDWWSYEGWTRFSGDGRYARLDGEGRPVLRHDGILAAASLSASGTAALFRSAGRKPSDARPDASFPLGVEAVIETASRHETLASRNVAGLLPGSDPSLSREVVVALGHLDHLGVGRPVRGDRIYNGALDNASGIAILLEMARAFSSQGPARRSVLFLAVTGEELGLHGSDRYAEDPTVEGPIVAAVNLDMVLMIEPLRGVVAHGREHSSLGAVVERAAGKEGVEVVPDPHPEQAIFVRSDHWSFARRGVPSVFLEVADSPRVRAWMKRTYHQPSDEPDQHLDLPAGAAFARLNYRIAREIADADARPAWNPGDPFEAPPAP